MIGQVFIKFRRSFSDFFEVPPRAVREIMVLNMIAQHEIRYIPPANIIISLLTFNELIMLCDNVNGGRMRAD